MAASAKRTAKIIGRQVTAHRGRLGLSRPGMADRLGIDRTYLWRIEKGLARPSGVLEDRMVDLFGITVDELRNPLAKRAA